MYAFYDATIDCDEQTRETYKWARGETDKDGNAINPISFPLEHCTVFHSGSRVSVTIAAKPGRGPIPSGPDMRLDVLWDAPDPKEQQAGQRTLYTIQGISERKHNMGIMDEHATVELRIIKHAGLHEPGQPLVVT